MELNMKRTFKIINIIHFSMIILTTAFGSSDINKTINEPRVETMKKENNIEVVEELSVNLHEKVMRIVETEDGVKIMFGISAGVYRLKSSNENFKILLEKLKESKKAGTELKITANSTSLEILNAE